MLNRLIIHTNAYLLTFSCRLIPSVTGIIKISVKKIRIRKICVNLIIVCTTYRIYINIDNLCNLYCIFLYIPVWITLTISLPITNKLLGYICRYIIYVGLNQKQYVHTKVLNIRVPAYVKKILTIIPLTKNNYSCMP